MAKNDRLGFTLLELLVALAIASLILVAAYTTLLTLTKAHEKASQEMEQRRALRNTMDLLRRELAATLFRTSNTRLRFVVQDKDFYGKPASTLTFATLGPPTEGLASDQLQVRYQISEENDNQLNLRRISRGLFAEGELGLGYPLIYGVEGFQVECHNGSTWVKTWDTALTNALPQMIRVTITMREADQKVPYHLIATPRMVSQ